MLTTRYITKLGGKMTRRDWIWLALIIAMFMLQVYMFFYRTPQVTQHFFPGIVGEKGEKGEDGYTPIKGVDYFDGINGKVGEKGEKGDPGEPSSVPGPQGPQGEPGAAARQLEIRCNEETQQFETRYTGDSDWTSIGGDCVAGRRPR